MAQVEQIIDDELVVGANGDSVAFGCMHLGDVVEDAEVRHFCQVGRLFTHPNPDRLVLFRHRIAAHAGAGRNIFRSMRVQDASSRRVEFQSVIETLNAFAADDLAHTQRCESGRTAILQCGDMAVRFSEKDDRLFPNRAAEQLTVGEIIGPGGDIPRVAHVGPANHFLFTVEKLELHCARHRGSSMAEADLAEARTPQWLGRRTCANAADYLSAHRCGSSRRLGAANGRKAARGALRVLAGRERSIYIGNQTARRAITLWRSPKAPLPPQEPTG